MFFGDFPFPEFFRVRFRHWIRIRYYSSGMYHESSLLKNLESPLFVEEWLPSLKLRYVPQWKWPLMENKTLVHNKQGTASITFYDYNCTDNMTINKDIGCIEISLSDCLNHA